VIISVTYGKQTASDVHDPEVVEVEKCVARLTRSLAPGKYAIESYPFLRYMPGYLTELRMWHEEELHLFKGQYRKVAKEMVCDSHWHVPSVNEILLQSSSENVPPSFAKSMIQSQQELGLSEDEAAYVCGSMFGAGSDTVCEATFRRVMAYLRLHRLLGRLWWLGWPLHVSPKCRRRRRSTLTR
jgi:hypothetical protein